MTFSIIAQDGQARSGTLITAHGDLPTPLFLPVATLGTVKALGWPQVHGTGTRAVIMNAYLLGDRPGLERIGSGVHAFTGWDGGIFCDSGGFQVVKDQYEAKLAADGMHLKSPYSGKWRHLTPIYLREVQEHLQPDVAMVLDDCPPTDAGRERWEAALERTSRWAREYLEAGTRTPGTLHFGIVQGGLDQGLRERSASQVCDLPFDGFALGGLALGEDRPTFDHVVRAAAPLLPEEKPRYLMGVGHPLDIITGIAAGVDVFDSVYPTRNGRHGSVLTMDGSYTLPRSSHKDAEGPLEEGCPCPVCARHDRRYLHHLFKAKEFVGGSLVSEHNLWFMQRLVGEARSAIAAGTFPTLEARIRAGYA